MSIHAVNQTTSQRGNVSRLERGRLTLSLGASLGLSERCAMIVEVY